MTRARLYSQVEISWMARFFVSHALGWLAGFLSIVVLLLTVGFIGSRFFGVDQVGALAGFGILGLALAIGIIVCLQVSKWFRSRFHTDGSN